MTKIITARHDIPVQPRRDLYDIGVTGDINGNRAEGNIMYTFRKGSVQLVLSVHRINTFL